MDYEHIYGGPDAPLLVRRRRRGFERWLALGERVSTIRVRGWIHARRWEREVVFMIHRYADGTDAMLIALISD